MGHTVYKHKQSAIKMLKMGSTQMMLGPLITWTTNIETNHDKEASVLEGQIIQKAFTLAFRTLKGWEVLVWTLSFS